MRKGVYYNEFDRAKAAWLRHLIEEGVIAHGVVDERSIHEVQPEDLDGFAQCHFFAGIGVWSHALRRAGVADDHRLWTGSCPCGPFSVAGIQKGFADPRHLWPEWFRLIRICRPDLLFGEQVDAADAWIDLVSSDLEGMRYAFGSPDLPAAGFGGAHIRQRFMWVADADNAEWWSERAPWHDGSWPAPGRVKGHGHTGECGDTLRVGHACGDRSDPLSRDDGEVRGLPQAKRQPEHGPALPRGSSAPGWLGEPNQLGGLRRGTDDGPHAPGQASGPHIRATGLLGGARADWLYCRDGRWRPIEPGLSPVVDASPGRVVRLRGYGDAIDAEALTQFIAAYFDEAPPRLAA